MILDINNLSLNFQVYGSGQPLILLHGWGDKSDSWTQVASLLADKFQVYLVDLPGFGASQAPKQTWGVEEYRDTIRSFIDEMEISKPILVGHSHGGKIACELIANGFKAHSLVLLASSGVDIPSLKVKTRVALFKIAKHILLKLGTWGEQRLSDLRGKLGSRDYKEAGALRDTMVKVVNHKLFATLQKLHLPTLIIWGSKDTTLPMEQAKIFRKNIPGSAIRILWDATHHPHFEQPFEISQMIKEFYQFNER